MRVLVARRLLLTVRHGFVLVETEMQITRTSLLVVMCWVQERCEAIPVMENSAGSEASFLDGALQVPAAHIPSFPPLPACRGRSS